VNEEDGTATLTVCLDATSTEEVTIAYATADGSADATDYTAASGTITIPAGDLCAEITVAILDDLINEETEELVVNLTSASNAVIGDPQGTITILDNDVTPDLKLSIDDTTVDEEDGTATLKVCLDLISGSDVTVDYNTVDDSALEAVDYVAAAGSLTIPAGELCVDVVITIVDDATPEDTEVLEVVLSNEDGAVVADGIGTITILDSDVVAPLPALNIKNVTVNEEDGTALVDVCLETLSDEVVTVEYATADVSAEDGSDYSAVSGTITIPAGEQCVSVEVPVLDDDIEEDTEILYVNLTNATNATIADPQGTVTILDTDAPLTGGCDDIVIEENNGVITTSGYSDPIVFVKIYDNNWNLLFDSGMLMNNEPQSYTLPSAGDYWVFVKTYGMNWAPICDEYQIIKIEDEPDGICTVRTASNLIPVSTIQGGAPYGGFINIAGQGAFYDLEDGTLTENTDGTAQFIGTWVNKGDSTLQFDIELNLTGRTNEAGVRGPKLSEGLTPDYDKFYYYSDFTGSLIGKGLAEGAVIDLFPYGSRFQLGVGANATGAEELFGASAWLDGTVTSQPTTSLVIDLVGGNGTQIGDLNVILSGSVNDCIDFEKREVCTARTATNTSPCTTIINGTPYGGFLNIVGENAFYNVEDGELTEYDNGTAIFAAKWVNLSDPSLRFDIFVELSGKTGTVDFGGPKLGTCVAADYDKFYYYSDFEGYLVGNGKAKGAVIEIFQFGSSFQLGDGANATSISETFGASAWIDGNILSQPATSFEIELVGGNGTQIGDINIDLSGSVEDCADFDNREICVRREASNITPCETIFEGQPYGGFINIAGEGAFYDLSNAELIEYTDGTALLTGLWTNFSNPGLRFELIVELSGKTASIAGESPKEATCLSPDYDAFYYYPELSGYLVGDGIARGALLELSRVGESFQIGVGANATGGTEVLGASAWLSVEVLQQPTATNFSIALIEDSDGKSGDINLNLSGSVEDCPADETVVVTPPTNSPCGTTVTTAPGSISIGGYSEPIAIIQIFDANWASVYSCMGDCVNPLTVDGLAEGAYYVKVKLYNENWQEACTELAGYYAVSGTNLVGQDGDMLDFNAVKDGREVLVNWTVNTAYKTDVFITERSDDGLYFTPVMDLKNERNTEEATYYNDRDESPKMGRNFYRLKQVFVDGTYRYSKIKTIDFDLNVLDFTVYPNPTTDMIYINLSEYSGLSGTIQLTNGLGIALQEVNMDAIPMEAVGLEVAKYPAGMYNINVKLGDRKQLTKRFVKGRK